ncbi:hypothetical protein DZB88_20695 [Bacillus sp. OE]|nr:hypothetical protein DZB88_20695 [Bacillus sp. OE]
MARPPREHTPSSISLNISTIFQLYRTQLKLYQRFFEYINGSTQHIDLPTILDKQKRPTYPPPNK